MPSTRPVPNPTNASAPYWEACRKHVLRFQRCAACNYVLFYPGYACPVCWSNKLEWITSSGRGSIYSLTVVEHPATDYFAEIGPVTVALVELEEGPIMMTNIVGSPPHDARIGDKVTVDFVDVNEAVSLPVFRKEAGG